ncbi:MAG TPA: hypothetical protein VK171_00825 [Fimbriimonas sp.]|nr:hypothetical protein [Fimbriimonas sp.]
MDPHNFPESHVLHAKLAALRITAEKVAPSPHNFWSQELGATFLDLAISAGETAEFDIADELVAKAEEYGLPPDAHVRLHLVKGNNLTQEAGMETHAPTRGQLLRMALSHYDKATSTRLAPEAHHGIGNIYQLKCFDVATKVEAYALAGKAFHHAKLAINGGASSWGANRVAASALMQLIYSAPTGRDCIKHISELEKFCTTSSFEHELGHESKLFFAYCDETRSGFVEPLAEKVLLLENSLRLINSMSGDDSLVQERIRSVVTSTTRMYDAIWMAKGSPPAPGQQTQALDDYLDVSHHPDNIDLEGSWVLLRKSRVTQDENKRVSLIEEAIDGLQRQVDFGYYPTLARATLGLAMATLAYSKGEPFANRSLYMSAEAEIELAIETDPSDCYLLCYRAALHALQGDSDLAASAIVTYSQSSYAPTDSGLDPWYYRNIWHATKFKEALRVLKENYKTYN